MTFCTPATPAPTVAGWKSWACFSAAWRQAHVTEALRPTFIDSLILRQIDEFRGTGMMVTEPSGDGDTGVVVHFRKGAPSVRLTGTSGEILHPSSYSPWHLYKDVDSPAGTSRIEWPWPGVQLNQSGGAAIDGLNEATARIPVDVRLHVRVYGSLSLRNPGNVQLCQAGKYESIRHVDTELIA